MSNTLILLLFAVFTSPVDSLLETEKYRGELFYKLIDLRRDIIHNEALFESAQLDSTKQIPSKDNVIREEYTRLKENNLLDKNYFYFLPQGDSKENAVCVYLEDDSLYRLVKKYKFSDLKENHETLHIEFTGRHIGGVTYICESIELLEKRPGDVPFRK